MSMFIKPILSMVSGKIKKFLKTDSIVLKLDFQNNKVIANDEPFGNSEFLENKTLIIELLQDTYNIKNVDALVLIDQQKNFSMEIYYRDEQNNKLKKVI